MYYKTLDESSKVFEYENGDWYMFAESEIVPP